MAVEIPVVVDIEGAFKDAATRVNKAIAPLQDYMDANALQISLKIGDHTKLSVGEILNDATISAKQLEIAIADIEKKIARLSARGGFDLTSELKYSEKIILQAYSALENKAHGAADASKAMAKVYEANLERIQAKVAKLSSKLDDLTRKQNKTAVRLNADKEIAKIEPAYSRLGKQIDKTRVQLNDAKQSLKLVSFELEKIRDAGGAAALAVGNISGPAATLAAQWRRGEEYVNRWNAALGTANSRLGTLIKGSISLIALHSARTFVRNIREVTAEFEMQRVALGGIIQDTEMAEKLFRQIKAAAIQSPFEIKDLVTYTKQLSAYQIKTEDLFKTMMKLADVSAGLGVDMNRLILAYGQVRAASVLRGQELRQFTEAGIPLVEKLAEKFRELGREGTTTADVFELISQRAVPFRMIEEIFDDMTSAGGEFYRMQEVQSETLKGQWMKLKDALSIMYDEIGNTRVVHKAMEDLLSGAMKLMQNWRETGKAISAMVAAMVAYKIAIVNAKIAAAALTATEMAEVSALSLNVVGRSRLIAAILGESAATKAQIALGNLYVRVKTKEMMATNLFTKSLWKMVAAFLANPYAIAIAGIAALTVGLIRLTSKTNEATISYDELQKSLSAFDRASTHTQQLEDMASAYETLSAKVNKSEDDQKKLDRVTKELAGTFPAAVSGINEETNALIINIDKVKELTGAEKELAEARMRRDEKRAKKRIEQLEKEQKKILSLKEQGGENVILPAGGVVFREWTDEDLAQMSIKLQDVNKELTDMRDLAAQVDNALNGVDENTPKVDENTLTAWKAKLSEIQERKKAAGMPQIFSPDEIQQLGTVNDLWKKTKKGIEDSETALASFKALSLTLTDQDAIDANNKAIEQTEKVLEFWQEVKKTYGFVFKSTRGGRDTRLSQLKSDISELTNAYKKFEELKKYKTEDEALIDINKLFPQLEGKIPSLDNVVSELEKRLEQVKKDLARSPKSKTLLDMKRALETEISNLKFDDLKNGIEKQLQRISDEIKRSEAAQNFYKDIFDLTGDERLATSLSIEVYGGIGDEFKDRLQKQLNTVLSNINADTNMSKAFADQDFGYILDHLSEIPEKWHKEIKDLADAQQKFSIEQIKTWLKELKEAKTYAEQRVQLAQTTAARIAEINASNLKPEEKAELIGRYTRREAEETAKLQYEAFKNSPMYVELFANLDTASASMLQNMRNNLAALKDEWRNLSPQELKELQSRLNELDRQLANRNPFQALVDSLKKYRDMNKERSREQAESDAINADRNLQIQKEMLEEAIQQFEIVKQKHKEEDQEYQDAETNVRVQQTLTDVAEEQAEAAQHTANSYRDAAQQIASAADAAQNFMSQLSPAVDSVKQIVETFGSDETTQTFNTVTEGVMKTVNGVTKVAGGIARAIANPADVTAYVDVIAGLGDVIAGTFGTHNQLLLDEANRKIEEQNKVLEQLERSYDKLENAIERSFGSDYLYNYNEQMDILLAKQEAYRKQAEAQAVVAEKSSKKADRDAAAEEVNRLNDEAAKAEQEMEERVRNMQEFFAGTSLTSAAEEFAKAWLNAYREFGNTSEAIKEKMQDMIENIIVKSSLAKVAETVLKPFYDAIEEAARSQTLIEDVPSLISMLQGKTAELNNSLNAMGQILTANGIQLRGSVGSLSGISRDIASASEESILALAAGINTQNFYMSYVPTISADLRQIVDLMSIGTGQAVTTTAPPEGPVMPSVQEMVYDHLPNIDRNMAELLRLVSNVVKPNGTSAPYYVATKM